MTSNDKTQPRQRGGVAPTFAAFLLQSVVVGVIIVMFAWDLIGFEGCETCDPQVATAARLTLYIPVAGTLLLSIGAMVRGYFTGRATPWVPLVGCAVIVGAYVLSRSLLYGGY